LGSLRGSTLAEHSGWGLGESRFDIHRLLLAWQRLQVGLLSHGHLPIREPYIADGRLVRSSIPCLAKIQERPSDAGTTESSTRKRSVCVSGDGGAR
jgi:hypothetical protein